MSETKPSKFSFQALKDAATSDNAAARKQMFIEYFERFEEFPSYLFDNSDTIDARLRETIQDLNNDPETSKAMKKGIELLLNRLPQHGGRFGTV